MTPRRVVVLSPLQLRQLRGLVTDDLRRAERKQDRLQAAYRVENDAVARRIVSRRALLADLEYQEPSP